MLTDLNIIATMLEGLEEAIIARLIDRAQFRANEVIYLPGQSGFRSDHPGSNGSISRYHGSPQEISANSPVESGHRRHLG